MKHSYLFLADGFEEIEALATVDVLRRAGVRVETVSIKSDNTVTGANGVSVNADRTIDGITDDPETEWMICPGGMPGASNLAASPRVCDLLVSHFRRGGKVAAICASPAVVLAPLGILDGRTATCYPGMEALAPDQNFTGRPVEVHPALITSNGPANTLPFAYAIAADAAGAEAAAQVSQGMLFTK